MKVLFLGLLLTTTSFAKETIIKSCFSEGGTLESVEVIQNDSKTLIRITEVDGSHKDYFMTKDYKDFTGQDTIIASSLKSIDLGATLTDSIVFYSNPNSTKSTLAKSGVVYLINCQ
ncbi:MAG: hypothetical protein AB7I27_18370 [Bacteriovoracaceae bacterium]